MALGANLSFGSLGKERSGLTGFGKLMLIARLFHDRMAVDAGKTAARMSARLPIGLDAALVASKTRLVLNLGGLAGIFAKRNKAAYAFTASRGNVIATRTVTIFASSFFRLVARMVQKNLSHHGGREILKGRSMTGLANLVADVSGRA